jgi:hypothetical protein
MEKKINVCPPHEWRVSVVKIDGAAHDHHECGRCAAQKDVPQAASGWTSTWRRRSASTASTARAAG